MGNLIYYVVSIITIPRRLPCRDSLVRAVAGLQLHLLVDLPHGLAIRPKCSGRLPTSSDLLFPYA